MAEITNGHSHENSDEQDQQSDKVSSKLKKLLVYLARRINYDI